MSIFSDIYIGPKTPSQHFQPLLIEDIIATTHPLDAPYGKCSIIGKLLYDEQEKMYFLESVRIPALPQELQVPDGFFRIRLITGLLRKKLPLNCTVEAFGEIVLWNREAPHHDLENVLTKTSQDLYLELYECHLELAQRLNLQENNLQGYVKDMPVEVRKPILDELQKMKNKYRIVLKPYHISRTSNASEIIGLNLEIKFQMELKNKICLEIIECNK